MDEKGKREKENIKRKRKKREQKDAQILKKTCFIFLLDLHGKVLVAGGWDVKGAAGVASVRRHQKLPLFP